MTVAPLQGMSGPSGPVVARKREGVDLGSRHRQTIRMLRLQSRANFSRRGESGGLPQPRPSEGVVDWMVRAGLARTVQDASAGLARALHLDTILDELAALAGGYQSGADAPQPRPQADGEASRSTADNNQVNYKT
jgi:hypothetical protein